VASTDAKPVPQKNVAYRVTFPLLDADGDLVTAAGSLDSEVSKDGGAFADCTNEATEIATASGMYYLDLTSTEMNADTVAIIVKSAGAKTTPIVLYPEEAGDIRVNVTQVAGTNQTAGDIPAMITVVDDFLDTEIAAIKAKTDNLPADPADASDIAASFTGVNTKLDTIDDLLDTEVAAIKAKTDQITFTTANRVDAQVFGIEANAITAAAMAADAGAEIADAVWDEDATAHQTGGTFGQAIGDPGADTNTIYGAVVTGAAGATIAADIVDIEGKVDDLETRLGTPSDLGSGATVAANLADIEGQTDDIGAAGAGLTAVPWNPAWDAEVESEANDALVAQNLDHLVKIAVDTDFPTTVHLNSVVGHLADNGTAATFDRATDSLEALQAEHDTTQSAVGALSIPTVAAISDGVWDEATAGHTTSGTFGEQAKTDVDAIKTVTDAIGATGTGLTAIPWNAAWDAEVQSEMEDALDVTLADSVPADGTRPSVRQALYIITQFLTEKAVSGTTVTVKKVDGSTSLLTLTLDDATNPTSITRAT
jgi:hypothetical protein